MQIYLVGGAVRDFLIGRAEGKLNTPTEIEEFWKSVEKDWVVVGSTPEEMLALGYRPVGKSFPVFLHPETQEEYALARTERKTGKGYTGFECYAAPNVTLEEDLLRRDLTINAIAAPQNLKLLQPETIIDPFKGYIDLQQKRFRHVSDAFIEDPVRILRVARLACRFGEFHVAEETEVLMKKMVANGEIDALVAERVWQEWSRSLKELAPWRFLEILESCYALEKLFPKLNNSKTKKEALIRAVKAHASQVILLAIELHDLEVDTFNQLISRYRIPNEYQSLAAIVSKYFTTLLQLDWNSEKILDLLEKTDAFRRPMRFEDFLNTSHYLAPSLEKKSQILKAILQEVSCINNDELLSKGHQGIEFAKQLRLLRLQVITHYLSGNRLS